MSIIASRGTDQFALRFPDGLRDQIKADAEANGRSMNAEIVARLEGGAETLRDKFAGQALAAVFAWATEAERTADPEQVARWAYRCADAMIVVRKPGGLDL